MPASRDFDYRDMRLYQDSPCRRGHQDYYSTPGVRSVCHSVKQHEDIPLRRAGIRIMANHLANRLVMSGMADGRSHLVPIPQHIGYADYTLEIANLVAMATGTSVLNIVRCESHEPSYEQKLKGEVPFLEFHLTGDVPDDGTLFLVDNVIGTGQTFRLVNGLFDGRLVPLAFAVDYTRLHDEEILGLLSIV